MGKCATLFTIIKVIKNTLKKQESTRTSLIYAEILNRFAHYQLILEAALDFTDCKSNKKSILRTIKCRTLLLREN